MVAEQTAWLISSGVPVTDSSRKYEWNIAPTANVLAIFNGRGGQGAGFSETADADSDLVGIILDNSPFYYESGGQIFDSGAFNSTDFDFAVESAQAYAGYVVHIGKVTRGSIKVGQSCTVNVDYERRALIAPNHTMTHVLNFALKQTLIGASKEEKFSGLCEQKGSLVDEDRLRFDFSWNGALTDAQIAEVERVVNEKIKAGLPVFAEVVPLASAASVNGLRCVFGEKYPDPVRVISVGESVQNLVSNPSSEQWAGLSIEFCGGTHLSNTSEAEDFVLIEESGIAKGIRRISGMTRKGARVARQLAGEIISRLEHLSSLEAGAELVAASKNIKAEIDTAVVSLVDKERMRGLHTIISNKLKAWYKANLSTRVAAAEVQAETIARQAAETGAKTIVASLDFGADGKIVKKIQEKIQKIHNCPCFIVSSDDDGERVGAWVWGADAKSWLDAVVSSVGAGKGGGKGDQASGSFPLGNGVSMESILAAAQSFHA